METPSFSQTLLRWICPRRSHMRSVFLVALLLIVLIVEEVNVGFFYTRYMNHYSNEVVIVPSTTPVRSNRSVSIAVIVRDTKAVDEYALAQKTVRCYARMYNYTLHEIDVSKETRYATLCPNHTDFMFLRHCVMAHAMRSWTEDEWVLFLDADMAVINPSHLIEEYIPTNASDFIVFYNRIMNHEVMAGSYLVRNTEQARKFLLFWSEYEFRLPDSFHGSDNGAIHSVISEWADPYLEKERKSCETLWHAARRYLDLFKYEACVQSLLKKHPPTGIRLLPKGRAAWARDGWLTDNVWSDGDFIVHGWQKRRRDRMVFARWHSPLASEHFDMRICAGPLAHTQWRYKNSFLASCTDVDRRLKTTIDNMNADYESILSELRRQQIVFW